MRGNEKKPKYLKFTVLLIIPVAVIVYYFYSSDILQNYSRESSVVEGEVTLDGQGISVEAYTMAEGVFFPGDEVLAGITFANTSEADHSLWAGCSIRCPLVFVA